jgi:hypothetical protein
MDARYCRRASPGRQRHDAWPGAAVAEQQVIPPPSKGTVGVGPPVAVRQVEADVCRRECAEDCRAVDQTDPPVSQETGLHDSVDESVRVAAESNHGQGIGAMEAAGKVHLRPAGEYLHAIAGLRTAGSVATATDDIGDKRPDRGGRRISTHEYEAIRQVNPCAAKPRSSTPRTSRRPRPPCRSQRPSSDEAGSSGSLRWRSRDFACCASVVREY